MTKSRSYHISPKRVGRLLDAMNLVCRPRMKKFNYNYSKSSKHKKIKDIFKMHLNNISLNEIANILENRNILTPSQHKRKLKGKEVNPNTMWRSHVVTGILSQDLLTGHMMLDKNTAISYVCQRT